MNLKNSNNVYTFLYNNKIYCQQLIIFLTYKAKYITN